MQINKAIFNLFYDIFNVNQISDIFSSFQDIFSSIKGRLNPFTKYIQLILFIIELKISLNI